MNEHLVIDIPDELAVGLRDNASRLGITPQEVAIEYLKEALQSVNSFMTHVKSDEGSDPILQLIGRLQITPDIDVDTVINEHDRYIGENLEQDLHNGSGSIH